jgi:hypothetical protein
LEVGEMNNWTHYFDEETAVSHGVSAAIMIQHLRQWISKNMSEGKNRIDGHTWTFNSIKGWHQELPFWTEKQVRKILDDLIEKGVLVTANHNKVGFDRTLWYAFKDESIWLNGKKHLPEKANGDIPNGQIPFALQGEPIPSSLTSTLPTKSRASALPITDLYQDLYLAHYKDTSSEGVKPDWNGKIMKLVHSDMNRFRNVDLHLELIRDFFEHTPDYVSEKRMGMGYNIFHSWIDSLLERKRSKDVGEIHIVLNYETEQWEGITDEIKSLWAWTYRNCDIDAELENVRVKLLTMTRHPSDCGSYITTWLDNINRGKRWSA